MNKFLFAAAAAALLSAGTAFAQPATAGDWKADVEQRIDRELQTPTGFANGVTHAEVAMQFDADGRFQSATLRKSSGNASVDAEALRVANRISYPQLPTWLQGRKQTVAMQIFFGDSKKAIARPLRSAHEAAIARAAETDRDRAQANLVAQPDG